MGAIGKLSEAIIEDTIGRKAEVSIASSLGENAGQLSRWRQFVGSYQLPPLPAPLFVVHLGGKRIVRYRDRGAWSERASVPGTATLVPANIATEWLIDGELDVATVSLPHDALGGIAHAPDLSKMHFSFSDPLGVALTRQIISELHGPDDAGREAYLSSLVGTLQAHVLRGRARLSPVSMPSTKSSAKRIHTLIERITENPEAVHTLDSLATEAGMAPAYLCRVFKGATGLSPHQFVLRTKIERAKQMLEQSDLPAGQISDTLGFSSQGHFTRSFRQATGQTPSQYRQACAGGHRIKPS